MGAVVTIKGELMINKKIFFIMAVLVSVMAVRAAPVTANEVGPSSAEGAIFYVNEIEGDSNKKQYLIQQAEKFLANDKYREARDAAQYILNNIDDQSSQAEHILQQAKTNIVPTVQPVEVPLD